MRSRLERLALAAGFSAACVAASPCPDTVDLALLRSLNREARYSLAALQGGLLLSRSDTAAGPSTQPCALPPGILLETGKALYHLGEFARVRALFRDSLGRPETAYRRLAFESHFLEMRRPDLADSVLALLAGPSVKAAMAPGEGGLYGASALYLRGRLPEARAAWPRALPRGSAAGDGEGENPRRYLDLGYKRPWLGAGLSVVPGGGYLYAGESSDAVTALVAVSLCYGAAAFYGFHDAPLRATAAAALGGVFHLSSVYGGHRSVAQTNLRRRRAFLVALHPHLP